MCNDGPPHVHWFRGLHECNDHYGQQPRRVLQAHTGLALYLGKKDMNESLLARSPCHHHAPIASSEGTCIHADVNLCILNA